MVVSHHVMSFAGLLVKIQYSIIYPLRQFKIFNYFIPCIYYYLSYDHALLHYFLHWSRFIRCLTFIIILLRSQMSSPFTLLECIYHIWSKLVVKILFSKWFMRCLQAGHLSWHKFWQCHLNGFLFLIEC